MKEIHGNDYHKCHDNVFLSGEERSCFGASGMLVLFSFVCLVKLYIYVIFIIFFMYTVFTILENVVRRKRKEASHRRIEIKDKHCFLGNL